MYKKTIFKFLLSAAFYLVSAIGQAEPIRVDVIDLIIDPNKFQNKEIEVRCRVNVDSLNGSDRTYCYSSKFPSPFIWINNRKIVEKNNFRWLLSYCAFGFEFNRDVCNNLTVIGTYRNLTIEDANLLGAN
jgi:hypothetical protein